MLVRQNWKKNVSKDIVRKKEWQYGRTGKNICKNIEQEKELQ